MPDAHSSAVLATTRPTTVMVQPLHLLRTPRRCARMRENDILHSNAARAVVMTSTMHVKGAGSMPVLT